MIIQKMKYKGYRCRKVLAIGKYQNIRYLVLSLGNYPVAYIDVKNTKYNGEDDCDMSSPLQSIDVHGGFTYSERSIWINKFISFKGWWVGWDYAHLGDRDTSWENKPEHKYVKELYGSTDKEWTTEEIVKEVKHVINQINQYNGKEE